MNFLLENGLVVHNSGKSFSAKREIVNVFLLTDDSIIIADPENEYGPLVKRFGKQGQVIDLSPTSPTISIRWTSTWITAMTETPLH